MTNIRAVKERLKNRVRGCTFGAIKSEYDDPDSGVCFVYVVNREPLVDIAAQIQRFEGSCQSHVRDQIEAMLVGGRITQLMYRTSNAPADKQQFLMDIAEINPSQPCLVLAIGSTCLVKFQDEPGF